MARVLVFGGTGLLGQYLRAEGTRRGHDVVASARAVPKLPGTWRAANLSRPESLAKVVAEVAPDVVLNAAAMTDVDGCERDPEAARTINGKAAGALAGAARDAGAALVHFSTDYVFDGARPATESDEPHPLNQYGLSKLEGESRVRDAHPEALVLRLSAVFGWNRVSAKTNSVTWILGKLEARQEAPLFRDQRVTPTYAHEAALAAFDLLDRKARGVFHVAARDGLSRVEMGLLIAEVFGIPNPRIKPIATADVKLLARRPAAPCLVVAKAEETLKRPFPGFRECLEHMRATR